VRRFVSIRSSWRPSLSHDGAYMVFLTDITGIATPWILSRDQLDQLIPTINERFVDVKFNPRRNVLVSQFDINGKERWQLLMIDVETRDYWRISLGDDVIHQLGTWSRDGSLLAFSSNSRNGVDFDLYIYNVDTGSLMNPWVGEGINVPVLFLDDENVIVNHHNTNLDNDLFLVNIRTGKWRIITKHAGEAVFWKPRRFRDKLLVLTNRDREFVELALLDPLSGDLRFLTNFNSDIEDMDYRGGRLALSVNLDGYSKLYVGTNPSDLREVATPRGVIGDIEVRDNVYFTLSSITRGVEVWCAEPQPTQITRSPRMGVDLSRYREPESYRVRSIDLDIQFFMYEPIRGKPPYPTVVMIHGGPESQWRPGFNPLVLTLMELGYLILAPNYRGSTGFGKSFVHMDDAEKRINAVHDVASVVRWALERGLASNVCAYGASYGGYLVLMELALYPELWSCGVEAMGIVNLVTFLKNTGPWRRRYRIAEYGDPDRDREILMKLSPISYVDRIKAPLMVIHGRNDPRVPFSEAEQLINALRDREVPVEFLELPDEGHGVGKLVNRVITYSRIVEFIARYTRITGG